MQHTQHYQLSQFEKDDRIQMEDFNADNAAIDAALKAHDTAIGSKASSASVGALTTRVGDLETGKADAAAFSALQASVAALIPNVGSSGHNCRVAFGSYVGTGKTGKTNPVVINCGFCPVVVFLAYQTGTGDNAELKYSYFLRGTTLGPCPTYPEIFMTMTWSDQSLSYYSTSAAYQANVNGRTYYYGVLGYDKAAENAAAANA